MSVWTQLGLGLMLIFVAFMVSILPELFGDGLEYRITACDSRQDEMLNDSVDLIVLGDSITFSQVLNTYCNANATNTKLFYTKKGSALEVREVFAGAEAARCICPLRLQGRIIGLDKSEYTLRFVFDNRYAGQLETLKEFNVSVV